ncbi:hypothetical protein G5C51_32410 [Streptomyces sp. A7024]|uniref:Integral membrane protein n=1 Tax=Streptomyces coryli TaxID=1128680 RepID=A0A6G4U8S2_9ACTN|nr:hypothetical protein [Streptomyces coryli]NGN68584.1 hypothetical protein [Streptomyces coryli]
MTVPAQRAGADLRLIRAAVFTAVCVVLSAGGHVLASGTAVPLWTLGLAAAGVFVLAAACAGRERSLPGIAALLGIGQLGLHCLYGTGQHTAAPGTAGPGHESGAMALAKRLLCNEHTIPLGEGRARQIVANAGFNPDKLAPAQDAAHGAMADGGSHAASLWDVSMYSLPMLLGHVLAALAAGWLLRRGEAAVWRLVRLTAGFARTSSAPLRAAVRLAAALCAGLPAALPERGRVRIAEAPGPAAITAELQHSVRRRGPPAFGLAA